MFKSSLIKSAKYLLILIDTSKEDKISKNKYKNKRKSRNKIIKI